MNPTLLEFFQAFFLLFTSAWGSSLDALLQLCTGFPLTSLKPNEINEKVHSDTFAKVHSVHSYKTFSVFTYPAINNVAVDFATL